ncbi:MAG TPA: hypothetical protein VGB03_08035 [Acidimicrobiales bacterium]|jgi:hypothetical protein
MRGGDEHMNQDIEVIQNLLVFGVDIEGEELRVDIYGGDDCVCGTLIYRFSDPSELDERAELLRRWCLDATPVTYVRRDGSAALMDELSLLTDALEA